MVAPLELDCIHSVDCHTHEYDYKGDIPDQGLLYALRDILAEVDMISLSLSLSLPLSVSSIYLRCSNVRLVILWAEATITLLTH